MFNQRYGSHEINNDAGPREHGHPGLRTGTAGTKVNLHGKEIFLVFPMDGDFLPGSPEHRGALFKNVVHIRGLHFISSAAGKPQQLPC